MLFGILERAARCLPRASLRGLGRAVGWLAYYLAAEQRRVALANLEVAFGDTKPDAEKRRIARQSLQTISGTLATLFWSARLDRANLERYAVVDGPSFARVREMHQARRPMLFIAMHYGDFELLAVATALLGVPTLIIQEAMQNSALGERLARLRACRGHLIHPNRHAARALLKHLREGGAAALLIDLNSTRARGGTWLDFFGLPVFNSAAPAALAMHSGAVLVGGRAEPRPDGRVELIYGPFWEPAADADRPTELQRLNQQCLGWVEQHVRARPSLWMWNYKRWKYQPTEERAGYPYYARPGRIDLKSPTDHA